MRRAGSSSPMWLLVGATFAVGMLGSACTDSEPTPATAPTTITTPTTAVTTTIARTTTTEPATTTSLDRRTEIEAIFRDLEQRRLDALYRKDEAAFRELFANDAYLAEDLKSFEEISFAGAPSPIEITLVELLHDDPGCIAARLHVDFRSAFGPEAVGSVTVVIETSADGIWGYSYVGEGWECTGPHPLT